MHLANKKKIEISRLYNLNKCLNHSGSSVVYNLLIVDVAHILFAV